MSSIGGQGGINSAERLLRVAQKSLTNDPYPRVPLEARRKRSRVAGGKNASDNDRQEKITDSDYSEMSAEERKRRREALRRQRDVRVSNLQKSRRGTLTFTHQFSSLRSSIKIRNDSLRSELSGASFRLVDLVRGGDHSGATGGVDGDLLSPALRRDEMTIAEEGEAYERPVTHLKESAAGARNDRQAPSLKKSATRALSSWSGDGRKGFTATTASRTGTSSVSSIRTRSSLSADGSGTVTTSTLVDFLAAELRDRDADLALAAQLGVQVTSQLEQLQNDYEEAIVELRETHAREEAVAEKLDVADGRLRILDMQLRDVHNQAREMSSRNEEFGQELAAIHEDLADSRREGDESLRRVRQLGRQNLALTRALFTANERIAELESLEAEPTEAHQHEDSSSSNGSGSINYMPQLVEVESTSSPFQLKADDEVSYGTSSNRGPLASDVQTEKYEGATAIAILYEVMALSEATAASRADMAESNAADAYDAAKLASNEAANVASQAAIDREAFNAERSAADLVQLAVEVEEARLREVMAVAVATLEPVVTKGMLNMAGSSAVASHPTSDEVFSGKQRVTRDEGESSAGQNEEETNDNSKHPDYGVDFGSEIDHSHRGDRKYDASSTLLWLAEAAARGLVAAMNEAAALRADVDSAAAQLEVCRLNREALEAQINDNSEEGAQQISRLEAAVAAADARANAATGHAETAEANLARVEADLSKALAAREELSRLVSTAQHDAETSSCAVADGRRVMQSALSIAAQLILLLESDVATMTTGMRQVDHDAALQRLMLQNHGDGGGTRMSLTRLSLLSTSHSSISSQVDNVAEPTDGGDDDAAMTWPHDDPVDLRELMIYLNWIKRVLSGDAVLARQGSLSLLQDNSSGVYNAFRDGVLLCKLVNVARPGTIDERVLNIPISATTDAEEGREDGLRDDILSLSREEREENCSLCLNSMLQIGCRIDHSVDDLLDGRPQAILMAVWELVKATCLAPVHPTVTPELVPLMLEGMGADDDFDAVFHAAREDVLQVWASRHHAWPFGMQSSDGEVAATGVMKCERARIYYDLLDKLSPGRLPLDLADGLSPGELPMAFATAFAQCFAEHHCFLTAEMLASQVPHPRLDVAFLATAFEINHGLTKTVAGRDAAQSIDSYKDYLSSAPADDPEATVFVLWMNSLGVEPAVHNIGEDLRDGRVLLQCFEKLNPGCVAWGRVHTGKTPSKFERIQNTNMCIDLGRKLRFSLVGIDGTNIEGGNRTLTLALVWQLMRYHIFQLLFSLGVSSGGGGAVRVGDSQTNEPASRRPLSDAEIVAWSNETVRKAGKSSRIMSTKDRCISSSAFLFDLLDSLRPGIVDYSIVAQEDKEGDGSKLSREAKLSNARLALSVARKLGATIFLTPEDIVAVKGRLILTLLASIMVAAKALRARKISSVHPQLAIK